MITTTETTIADTLVRVPTPQPLKIQSKRILYTDILRISSCFLVIIIHYCANVFYDPNGTHQRSWLAINLIDSFARWCVPVFFMVSGAFIIGYRQRYSTRDFFMKRFTKVLIPFLAWTGIYIIWQKEVGIIAIRNISDVLNYSVFGPAAAHLWFFYTILGLYLITPIISAIADSEYKTVLRYFVVLCVINTTLFPIIDKFTGHTLYFSIPASTSYIGYFMLGWLIKDVQFTTLWKFLIYLSGIIGLIINAVGTIWLIRNESQVDSFFKDYENITVFMMSVAIFVLVKSVNWERVFKSPGSLQLLKMLTDATLGIYLIHIIVMYYLQEYVINKWHLFTLYSLKSVLFVTLVGALITFLISFGTITILRKIPLLKIIVP